MNQAVHNAAECIFFCVSYMGYNNHPMCVVKGDDGSLGLTAGKVQHKSLRGYVWRKDDGFIFSSQTTPLQYVSKRSTVTQHSAFSSAVPEKLGVFYAD